MKGRGRKDDAGGAETSGGMCRVACAVCNEAICECRAVLTLRAGGVCVRVRVEVSPLGVDVSDTDDGSEPDVWERSVSRSS